MISRTVSATANDIAIRVDGELAYPLPPYAGEFSPDGKLFACGTSADKLLIDGQGDLIAAQKLGNVTITDMATTRTIRVLKHSCEVSVVRFSKDGSLLATKCTDDTLRIWDTRLWKQLYRISDVRIVGCSNSLDFSPDGQLLTCANISGISVWNVRSNSSKRMLRHIPNLRAQYLSVRFSPKGSLLVAGTVEGIIEFWDVKTWKCIKKIRGHEREVSCLEFQKSGRILASAGYDRMIRLWEMPSCRHIRSFKGHNREVSDLEFFPNGTIIVSAGYDGTIRIWQTETGKQLDKIELSRIPFHARLALSPDGMHLATIGVKKKVMLWSLHRVPAQHNSGRDANCQP